MYTSEQRHGNNNKVTSWLFKLFTKQNKQLNLRDEAMNRPTSSSHRRERPRSREIDAVTSVKDKQIRQGSFLRKQLSEMKRDCRDTLLATQTKRIAGELVEEPEEEASDEESESSEEEDVHEGDDVGDDESVHSVEDLDAEVPEEKPMPMPMPMQRRSLHQENDDELYGHLNRATQLYTEALSHLDFALHPETPVKRAKSHSDPVPFEPQGQQPLLLGVKKGKNRMKNEWI